jgi:hypothetical protein
MAHQHYKGTGQMHSFRGLLADGGQDKIRIQGPTGQIAWRITKLNVITNLPGTANGQESIVMIWREEQDSVSLTTATCDFNNDELLGVAFWKSSDAPQYAQSLNIIFDNSLFSRNIYITHTDTHGSSANSCNYYIELEEVKVSAAGMAQLAVAAARRGYLPGA